MAIGSLELGAGSSEPRKQTENVQRSTSNAQLSTAEVLRILRKWGVATLGQLAVLDKEELRTRLGSEAVRLWERATGTSTRLLKFVQPPETFDESFEFDHEIETAEPLLFMLRRFLEQLSLRLSSIYLVARELTLTITFSDSCQVRYETDSSDWRNEPAVVATATRPGKPTNASAARTYERVFKIPQPTNDVDLLFRMLQTHLENPAAAGSEHPIVAVALTAQPIRSASQQFGLFETALRNPQQLYETLARLSALLGNDRVGSPVLEETHRPDAFRMETFDWSRNDECRMTNDEKNHRVALRRFRPAAAASIFTSQDRHLQSGNIAGKVIDQLGPFLFSGNWWDEKFWTRGEWDMQLENGDLIRAHEDPPSQGYGVTGGTWKVDGVYD